jgi:hypothetical protein
VITHPEKVLFPEDSAALRAAATGLRDLLDDLSLDG